MLVLIIVQRMRDCRELFVSVKFGDLNIWTYSLPSHNTPWTILGGSMLE